MTFTFFELYEMFNIRQSDKHLSFRPIGDDPCDKRFRSKAAAAAAGMPKNTNRDCIN